MFLMGILLTPSAAALEPDIAGRMGMSAALQGEPLLTLAYAHVDFRFQERRTFMQLSTGIQVPAELETDRAYGGLSAEFGIGWFLTEGRPFSPYLGVGYAGRLQQGVGTVVGIAPYGHLGVLLSPIGPARPFIEARVYQNVMPVGVDEHRWYPTELGGSIGAMF